MRSGGSSSAKFCRLDDEILSRVERKLLFQTGAWVSIEFLSFVQSALLSASYNNIFEGKTGYLCGEVLLEKRFVRRPSSVEAARKVSPDW